MKKQRICRSLRDEPADPGALASRRRVALEFTLERVSGNKLKLELQPAGETPALPGLGNRSHEPGIQTDSIVQSIRLAEDVAE
jgi:hypothetical protein